MRIVPWLPVAGLLLAALPVRAEDDLDVVKHAVAAEAQRPPSDAAPRPAVAAPRTAEPQWLRVRVYAKGKTDKPKVTVNLPLAFVRAVGEDWPLDFGCHRQPDGARSERCSIKLAEVLKALESGQELVSIESEDETVRVWVE